MLDALRRMFTKPVAVAKAVSGPTDLSALVALDGHEKLTRLGTPYGGWQTPLGRLRDGAVCYCAGAGEDVSFDVELLSAANAEVHVLDPTPRAIAHVEGLIQAAAAGRSFPVNNDPSLPYRLTAGDLSRFHFHPLGVWNEDTTLHFHAPQNPGHVSHSIVDLQKTGSAGGFDAPVRTIATLMREFGHDRLDLLKIDIEGAEYAVIGDMLATGVRPGVVMIEFDEGNHPPATGGHGRIRDCIQALRAQAYRLVGIEGWNATLVRNG